MKGILFFSFWQSIGISVLVAARVITSLGPYTDAENVSVGLNDLLISIEMPLFAFAHMYAFSHKDYIDPRHTIVARMPMYYAFRDAFGMLDVVEDSKATLRGEGMDYREFEPAEGFMHQGSGRDRRIRAGLRYSKGGQRKYWLPKVTEDTHSPLLNQDVDHGVHLAPDLRPETDEEPSVWPDAEVENGFELPFGDLDEADEELYAHSQKYLFGDYNYPSVDVSSESARTVVWDEEERILRNERGAWFSPIRGAKGQVAIQERETPAWEGYGAVSYSQNQDGKGSTTTRPSNKQFYDDEHTGDRVIDHSSVGNVIPDQPTDVIMRWTRSRKHHSHPQSPPYDGPSSVASGSGRGTRNNSRVRPSPPKSTSHQQNSRSKDTPSPTLPPDAVDLVVEDSHAAEEQNIHERRKGEISTRPLVSSHLKRVYHRGGEVGLEDHGESDLRGVGVGEEILPVRDDSGKDDEDVITDGDQDVSRPGDRSDGTPDRGFIAREVTPPLHARVQRYNYDDIPDNDNPWA